MYMAYQFTLTPSLACHPTCALTGRCALRDPLAQLWRADGSTGHGDVMSAASLRHRIVLRHFWHAHCFPAPRAAAVALSLDPCPRHSAGQLNTPRQMSKASLVCLRRVQAFICACALVRVWSPSRPPFFGPFRRRNGRRQVPSPNLLVTKLGRTAPHPPGLGPTEFRDQEVGGPTFVHAAH